MKDLRKTSTKPSLSYSKCFTSSCRYICEFFTSAKVNTGFGINQRIVVRSFGRCYAETDKFNTLIKIPKTMAGNNYYKKVSKIIDRVNFADVVYQRYSNKKIRECWALSKTSRNLVTKPKEKRKRTRWERLSYRCHNWLTTKLSTCSFRQIVGDLQNMKSRFLASLFHVASN